MSKLPDQNIEYSGVRGLADAAEQILKTAGTSQERGSVAEYPNERTIRYYIAEELLPEPLAKRGVTSVFGYVHLLSLLAIKKLQSDRLPISIIRELIKGKSTPELEELLGEKVNVKIVDDPKKSARFSQMNAAQLYEDLGEPVKKITDPQAIADYTEQQGEKNAATEYLEGLLFSQEPRARTDPPLFSRMSRSSAPAPQEPPTDADTRFLETVARSELTWRRHEAAPGLEIHIRSDYEPPAGFREMRKLLQKIKEILRR